MFLILSAFSSAQAAPSRVSLDLLRSCAQALERSPQTEGLALDEHGELRWTEGAARAQRRYLEPFIRQFVTFRLAGKHPQFVSGTFDGFDEMGKIRLLLPEITGLTSWFVRRAEPLHLLALEEIIAGDTRLGLSRPDLHSEREIVVFDVAGRAVGLELDRTALVGRILGFTSRGEVTLRALLNGEIYTLPRDVRYLGRARELSRNRRLVASAVTHTGDVNPEYKRFRGRRRLLRRELGQWVELEVTGMWHPVTGNHQVTGIFMGFDVGGNLRLWVPGNPGEKGEIRDFSNDTVMKIWTTTALRGISPDEVLEVGFPDLEDRVGLSLAPFFTRPIRVLGICPDHGEVWIWDFAPGPGEAHRREVPIRYFAPLTEQEIQRQRDERAVLQARLRPASTAVPSPGKEISM